MASYCFVPADHVPGFVPSTSLNRELSLPKRLAMSYVMPWLPFTTSPVDGK